MAERMRTHRRYAHCDAHRLEVSLLDLGRFTGKAGNWIAKTLPSSVGYLMP